MRKPHAPSSHQPPHPEFQPPPPRAGPACLQVRRASEVAQLFAESGIITMVTLISPYRKDRDAAREKHAKAGIPFLEVFMDVPIEVVKARDPKGLYAKVQTQPYPRP